MKYTRNIAILLLIIVACSGCNNNNYGENIDNTIPEIKSTDNDCNTVNIETNDEKIHICDLEHEHEHSMEDNDYYESYEDTYEGNLQGIYDTLYEMIDDINVLKGTDQYRDEYNTLLTLLMDAVDGHTQKNKKTGDTVYSGNMFSFHYYEQILIKLFENYPNEAAKETALIEFTRYYCYLYAVMWEGSTENLYENDALYNVLFPNTENIITNTEGNKTFINYDGYTGKIAVDQRVTRINQLRGNETVFSETAEIVNYTGTVSVAPVNQYGAVGRTSHVYVSQNRDDSIVNGIYINGNTIMINPDCTSKEFIDMQNQKEIRSVKENYLDSIDNVPNLTVLQVSHCELSDPSRLFAKIPMENINTLDLSNNDLEELDLSSFSSLDSLDLNGNYGLRSIKMPNRKSILYINLRDTSMDSLSFLAEYETVANLDIRTTAVPDLTPLAGKIVYNIDFDADITDYTGLRTIKELRSISIVSGKELSDDLMALVKSIETLQEFYYNYQVVPLS